MTELLNGDDPEFQEISPMITTLRYDLDQKIKRLTDALATVGIASTELEKVRIALEGTAPAALVSTLAHDTCIPIPAQAVIVAKKHEIVRALEAAQNAFDAVRESVEGVLAPLRCRRTKEKRAALARLSSRFQTPTAESPVLGPNSLFGIGHVWAPWLHGACEMAAELIRHLLGQPAPTGVPRPWRVKPHECVERKNPTRQPGFSARFAIDQVGPRGG